jgi:hypothetical protein
MGNIHNFSAIRQCFSFISDENFILPVSDYRIHKLLTIKCIKLLIASQIAQWNSYSHISLQLRTSETLQKELELESISASQISRRLRDLPTELLEALFLEIMGKVKSQVPLSCSKIGPLRIIDSTCLKLPETLAHWACLSKDHTRIKIHVRLLALPSGHVIPEKAIPSTGNVGDSETMDILAEDDGTIYIMDRGYISYAQFDKWVKEDVRFVVRLHDRNSILHVEKEQSVPANTSITRDAIVQLGSASTQTQRTLRLVEYVDEKGRTYRLVTSCLDLCAMEVAEIYKQRWLIELFFKWMKQHLRLVKLYSYDPQGIWNQIFIALITYAITIHIQLESGTKRSAWEVLQILRACWEKSWSLVESELHPQASRASKGRQKKEPDSVKKLPKLRTTVGIMKPRKEGKKKKKKN